jgi:predicted N-acetyltransferase YhbS
MGKNFHNITNLKEKPQYFAATLKLIEESFHYQAPHAFQIDFAPLMREANRHNCYILVNEKEEILAHLGVALRKLTVRGKDHTIAMLGGIAVDEKARGQGHFSSLMRHVMSEYKSEVAYFILWSELEKLYQKFGFYLCGKQYEQAKRIGQGDFTQTHYYRLNSQQKKNIKSLYEESFSSLYATLQRGPADWEALEQVTSADLYYREDQSGICEYFLMNKGQDLPGIIYEYGTKREIKSFLADIAVYGKTWSALPEMLNENQHFQFLLSPGDKELFSNFILDFTNAEVKIHEINSMKQEVYFMFNNEMLALPIEEFLRGILGPGVFEEIEEETHPLFISGVDSI